MSQFPEIIVYAWILLLSLQIIVPLLMFVGWSTVQVSDIAIKKLSPKKLRKKIEEKRRNTRFRVDAIGDVAANHLGNTFGSVNNLSASGICTEGVAVGESVDEKKITLLFK